MSQEEKIQEINRETYRLSLRKLNIFNGYGLKEAKGKEYLLLSTPRGNLTFKDVKEFVKQCAKMQKEQSLKIISPEFMLEKRNRLQFNQHGEKTPTGNPYILITGLKIAVSIDCEDFKEFVKDLIQLLK